MLSNWFENKLPRYRFLLFNGENDRFILETVIKSDRWVSYYHILLEDNSSIYRQFDITEIRAIDDSICDWCSLILFEVFEHYRYELWLVENVKHFAR